MRRMNVELARRIADAVEKRPELYDQTEWGGTNFDPERKLGGKCGTPCCIGGWAKHFLGTKAVSAVCDALGLPPHPEWGILGADWPIGWLERAGLEHRRAEDMFEPTAIEAATILRAMADEGVWWQ